MHRKNQNLSVEKVLDEFEKEENSPAHRKGTFTIDAPFEKALNTILKIKRNHKEPIIPKK
jgi:hypothetical protein